MLYFIQYSIACGLVVSALDLQSEDRWFEPGPGCITQLKITREIPQLTGRFFPTIIVFPVLFNLPSVDLCTRKLAPQHMERVAEIPT